MFRFPTARRRSGPAIRATLLKSTLLACALLALVGPARAEDPPFGSTADTVFDIIETGDPSSFVCLDYSGREIRQMWDKRQDGESDLETFLFRAHFSDSPAIDIILNPEFGTEDEARTEAMRYVRGLGQLPSLLRAGIRQFGIHKGDEGFHGGPGKIFMYQDRVTLRIEQNHLEESLMHESVHASLDAVYRDDPDWRAAQQSDGGFVTSYAAEHPEGEDLAESVLFAYALLRHPGRIPPVDSQDILRVMPARIEVISRILAREPKVAPTVQPPDTCK